MEFNQSLHVFREMAALGRLEQVSAAGKPYSRWAAGRRWIVGWFDKCYDPF